MALHAQKVSDWYAQEKQHDRERGELRESLDRALRDARRDGVQHLQLAIAVVARLGMKNEGTEIYRVEQSLRQRSSVAAKRVSATNEHALVSAGQDAQSGASIHKEHDMSNEPRIKSKTVTQTTITYETPQDLDEHDHDLDDEDGEDEDDTPAPAPAPTSRSRTRR